MTTTTRFPEALCALPQWILWRGIPEPKDPTRTKKLPINPRTLRTASSTNAKTWADYPYCVAALPPALEEWDVDEQTPCRGGGLGFVFTPDDPYFGLDLDGVRDPTTGQLTPWATQIVTAFATYTEISPSGTGVHLLGQGTVGEGKNRKPLEIYDRGRYFTMTGQAVTTPAPPLADCTVPLAWLLPSLEVLAKALKRSGERLSLLFAGQWERTGDAKGVPYESASNADLAFCSLLRQAGASPEQCDALMRLSGLYRPKWDERHGRRTYGAMTLAQAFGGEATGAKQHATPPPSSNGTHPPPAARRPHVVHMDQVEAQPVQWLWWPYIARGTVTMLDGDPGIGKSLLTLYLGAIVSNGHPLPDQQGKPTLPLGDPGIVVLLSAEDSVTHTIKQRLTDSKANQQHIKVVTSYFDEHGDEQFLTLDADNRPLLEQVLQEYAPTLVIIDPLQAFLGKMDMHRANETRPFMRGLQHLAETYQVSLVCVRHPAKPGQQLGKALHRGLGSVDFIGAARSGLFVEQHPVDRDKVLVCHFKNNLERLGRTQVFSKQEGRFAWAGVSRFTADVIAGGGPGPQPQALMEAMYWLETALENGLPQPAEILMQTMKEEGMKRDTIHRAKQALGIRSSKVADTWLWTLPPLPEVLPPDTITGSTGSTATTGSPGSTGSSPQTPASTPRSEDPDSTVDRQDPVDPVVVVDDLPPSRMRFARPATHTRGRPDRGHHP